VATTAARISGFIAKFTPEIGKELVAARKNLRARFPRGYELVFDNYNALVFGFSPTEKASDSFISIAAYPRWINLFFLNGKALKDPAKLLQGSGTRVRSIRLSCAKDLKDAAVEALIAQAVSPMSSAMNRAPQLQTVIKMESAKQRPRRPAT
jgi:hypothetical protein